MSATHPILANTILPAHREPITFVTDDGVRLVGELAVPLDRPPVATLVTFHPLPTQGGSSDSHVFRKLAWRLPALAGYAVLRFNTRGTTSTLGTSGGVFSAGAAERYDVGAALAEATRRFLPRIWAVGWSFGTDLVLMYACRREVEGAILLSPPLALTDTPHLNAWAASRKPVVALVPEWDTYLRPVEARRRFAAVPQAEVIGVDGARHLWVGEEHVRRVIDQIAAHVTPGAPRLARTWDGTLEGAAP